MFLEALTAGFALDKLRGALRSVRAIANSEEFRKLVAQITLIDEIKKQLEVAEAALIETGFPYAKQFTAIENSKFPPIPKSTKLTPVDESWVGAARIIYNPQIWETGEDVTNNLLVRR